MNVFSRTYAVLLFLIPVSLLLALNVADNIFEEIDRKEFMRNARVEIRLLSQQLEPVPASEWPEIVHRYSPVFDHRLSLLTPADLPSLQPPARPDSTENWMTDTASLADWWLLHRLDPQHYIWLQEDDRLENLTLEELAVVFIPLLIILILVAIAITYISRRIATPIASLSSTANAIASGQFSARAPKEPGEPIHSLVQRFNHMAERIETLVQEQQIMVGAIPHELRTPISRLRFALDMTREATNMEDLRRQIETLDHYVDDIQNLTEQTLTLSRLRSQPPRQERCRLDQLIGQLIEKHQPSGIKIDWKPQPLTAHTSPDLITLATRNLLQNALRYSQTHIQVRLEQVAEQRYRITVDDDGPGIPAAQREAIFKAFFRLDDSRSRKTGGAGLGLAMVALIAQRLDGQVKAGDGPLGGARLTFEWSTTR